MNTAREATARLVDLLRREQAAMADFLIALADFDRRRIWLELGYAGLFPFLHRELGLSKAAAFYRKVAAELLQQYPEIELPLREGYLCMTAIAQLAKVITPQNRREIIPRFFHLSAREAEAVVAAMAPVPAPPRREVVTAVRTVAPALEVGTREVRAPERSEVGTREVRAPEPTQRQIDPCSMGDDRSASPQLPASPVATRPPTRSCPHALQVEPLTADLRRLHVTVSQRFLDKLEAATAALSHSHPGASAEQILDAGLDLLLDRAAKRKGLVKNPQRAERPSAPGHIPARVKREVWKRDGGKCQWPLQVWGVCGSTLRLQFDHVFPDALGGPATTDNLRLTCATHNIVAARRIFGDAWMDQFTARGRGGQPEQRALLPRAPSD